MGEKKRNLMVLDRSHLWLFNSHDPFPKGLRHIYGNPALSPVMVGVCSHVVRVRPLVAPPKNGAHSLRAILQEGAGSKATGGGSTMSMYFRTKIVSRYG